MKIQTVLRFPKHHEEGGRSSAFEQFCTAARPVAACLLLLQFATGSAGGEAREPAKDSSLLSLEQAVIVINELSPFQVNLECANAQPPERVSVPVTSAHLDGLTNASGRLLRTLLAQASNYELVRSKDAYTLVPRPVLGSQPRLLDFVVPEFRTPPTNLFFALFSLCKAVPFTIEVVHPVVVTSKIEPKLTLDYPHWPLSEMPSVRLAVTNAAVRDILSALINPEKKAYWVARPVHEPAARLLGTNASSVVVVEVHHAHESRHVSVPLAR